jgi:uncharacterized delta-60 repeat protein
LGLALGSNGEQDMGIRVLVGVAAGGMLVAGCGPASSGALDAGFGGDGVVTTAFSAPAGASFVFPLTGGKLLAVGDVAKNGGDIALARYLADGRLDTTFGPDHTGKATYGTAARERPTSAAVDPSGRIVVAGWNGTHASVWRFTSTGSLDKTFAGDGTRDFNWSWPFVAALPDGKVAATSAVEDTPGTVEVRRFTTGGADDPTFGAAGVVTFEQPGGAIDESANYLEATGIVALPDGRLVVGGYHRLERLNSTGRVEAWPHPLRAEGSPGVAGLRAVGSSVTVRTFEAGPDIGGFRVVRLDGSQASRMEWTPDVFPLTANPVTDLAGRTTASGRDGWQGPSVLRRVPADGWPAKVTPPFGVADVAALGDGRVVAAGSAGGMFAVARFAA